MVICGDRFEQLAIAMAAAYLNITIAHIEGGDVTGSIDESVRHAITKLAHLHFVTNDDAHRRVLAMGEDPRYVFNTGSLDVELAAHVEHRRSPASRSTRYGVGHDVDIEQPFLMVDAASGDDRARQPRAHLETTLQAVASFELPTIWFWPNPDAGTGEMADSLRHMREEHPRADRADALHHQRAGRRVRRAAGAAACLVGNSSAGIKECSFLGTPVVNIGARQQGRTGRRRTSIARRLRRATRSRGDRSPARARPLRAVAHLPPGQHQRARSLNMLATRQLYTQKRFHDRSRRDA